MSRIEGPSEASTPLGGVSQMAGPAEAPLDPAMSGGTPNPVADPQQALSAAVQVCRQAEESIVALSEQFPHISPEVRSARAAIQSVLQAIVANPGMNEPPAPRTML